MVTYGYYAADIDTGHYHSCVPSLESDVQSDDGPWYPAFVLVPGSFIKHMMDLFWPAWCSMVPQAHLPRLLPLRRFSAFFTIMRESSVIIMGESSVICGDVHLRNDCRSGSASKPNKQAGFVWNSSLLTCKICQRNTVLQFSLDSK